MSPRMLTVEQFSTMIQTAVARKNSPSSNSNPINTSGNDSKPINTSGSDNNPINTSGSNSNPINTRGSDKHPHLCKCIYEYLCTDILCRFVLYLYIIKCVFTVYM